MLIVTINTRPKLSSTNPESLHFDFKIEQSFRTGAKQKKQVRFILEKQKGEEFVFGLGEPNIQRRKPFFSNLVQIEAQCQKNKQNTDTILR